MKVRLQDIRGDRNLEDIAAELGVAISTVQRWEKHTMSIPSLRLPEIARAYGCSVSDIFADDDETEEDTKVIRIWDHIPQRTRADAIRVLSAFVDDEKAGSGD